jgi:phenylalanyl-tRNA synthetase beta chain
MKVSYKFIKDFIDFDLDPQKLGELLTSTGLEVEDISKIDAVKGGLEGLVVGEVIECSKHPEADKLSLTKVHVGNDTILDIVCGAPNVATGQKVAVALVGATLYPFEGDFFIIKKSKIRGAVSEGMLCAEDEIGLGQSHEGIMVLNTQLPNGTPLASHFKLEADYCIEIGLTPNRADAASHLGVARDIKAVTGKTFKKPDISGFKTNNIESSIKLKIESTEACPRFCGLEIKGIEVKPSPDWLKNFLQTIGLNSINNIVDISNYICHYLGQPMHIYDADQLEGGQIIVRMAKNGEILQTLDGKDRILTNNDLIIADSVSPVGIAGVFGGKKSGVSENTKNVYLEVAYFNPNIVRKSSTFHQIKTDASFRYERGTDPEMPIFAIKLAALMVQQLAGGHLDSPIEDQYPDQIKPFVVKVKYRNINRLIGNTLDKDLIKSILLNLDIKIANETADDLSLIVPAYRVDVTREADVIEEILRIHGFDNIGLSENLSSDFISEFPIKDSESMRVKLSESLAAGGLSEIQSLSIVKSGDNQVAENIEEAIVLLNPLSEDLTEMRREMLFSGLNAINYNINRRNKDLKFFEFGRTYQKQVIDGKPKLIESHELGIWITGLLDSESWMQTNNSVAFKHLNQLVMKVMELMKVQQLDCRETTKKYFDYGLDLIVRNKVICSMGLVSEKFQKAADIKQKVFYAVFDWTLLQKVYNPEFKFNEISKYPEVRRDLSLVLENRVKFDQIKKLALQTEKKLLKNVNVFDVYQGEKLAEGQKSYSVSFILQDIEKTLNDQTIDKVMQKLINVFENEMGAVIRK